MSQHWNGNIIFTKKKIVIGFTASCQNDKFHFCHWRFSVKFGTFPFQWSRYQSVSAKSIVSWWRHQMETFFALLALCTGEFTGDRGIPRTKARDAKLWCFLWSAPELTLEQTMETPVIWHAIAPIMTSLQWLVRSGIHGTNSLWTHSLIL